MRTEQGKCSWTCVTDEDDGGESDCPCTCALKWQCRDSGLTPGSAHLSTAPTGSPWEGTPGFLLLGWHAISLLLKQRKRPYHALLVSLLDRVPCNGCITIILRRCPRQGNILSPDILDLHKLGRPRAVYRVSSQHRKNQRTVQVREGHLQEMVSPPCLTGQREELTLSGICTGQNLTSPEDQPIQCLPV